MAQIMSKEALGAKIALPSELIFSLDYQAYICKIRDNFQDRAPYLIWADWLDEYGSNNRCVSAHIKAILLRKGRLAIGDLKELAMIRGLISNALNIDMSPFSDETIRYGALRSGFGFESEIRRQNVKDGFFISANQSLYNVELRIYDNNNPESMWLSRSRVLAAHPYSWLERMNLKRNVYNFVGHTNFDELTLRLQPEHISKRFGQFVGHKLAALGFRRYLSNADIDGIVVDFQSDYSVDLRPFSHWEPIVDGWIMEYFHDVTDRNIKNAREICYG